MNNFDKAKEEFKITDMGKSTNSILWGVGFCNAIHRVKKETNCGDRYCERCIEWLKEEYKEQTLDEVEKKYLSAVIKPFRDRVKSIEKKCVNELDAFLLIELKKYKRCNIGRTNMQITDTMSLPYFQRYTMYKGMDNNRRYTLKELGL